MAIRRDKATRDDTFDSLSAALPVSLNGTSTNRSRLLEELAKELKRVSTGGRAELIPILEEHRSEWR